MSSDDSDTASPPAASAGKVITGPKTSREVVLLVPAEITGSSSGAGVARVGLGFLAGFGDVTDPTGWDISAVIEAEVATSNGLATLLGLSREGEVTEAPVGSLRLSASFARLDFAGEGGSAYPPLILYAGAALGRAEFAYLGPGPTRRDTSLPPTFAQEEQAVVPFSLGAAAVYIADGWTKIAPTVEAQLAFESRWIASNDTVSFCEPVGDIVSGVDPETGDPVYSPSERCTKATLGAPENRKDLSFGAHVGLVDKAANATWRAALGAKVAIPLNEGAEADVAFSVRAPFYVTLARAPEGTQYRGLIRLQPSMSITRLKAGETDVTGLLELSFLGQRGMFSDQYNDL